MGLFDDLPDAAPVKITVRPDAPDMSAEGPQANNRGFRVQDVQAAVRGDAFNSPGLPVRYEAQPGQRFGESATANAQPFNSIVAHHTGGPTLEGALNTARQGDPFRNDVKFGYHFYIDKDGTVVQGAPMDARTNHVQPPSAAQRTARPDISNSNSVGISFVGDSSNPTPEQLSAAQNLSRSLMDRYGIQANNVVGHGQIQANRQTSEGMPLVNAIQGQQAVAQAPPQWQGPQMGGSANAAPPQAAPQPQAQPQRSGLFDDIGPAKPDVGRGRAFLTGAQQGASFNFGDELSGAAAAAGTPKELSNPFDGPSNAITGLAKLGYEYLTGGDTAAKRYSQGRDEFRNLVKQSEEQYPGTTLAGNVAGAVALPLGGAMNAATLPARMGRGAALGAATGAVSGAGEGTTGEDRASRAAIGTVAGGVLGGVAPPLVEGGAKLIGAAVSKPVNLIRSAVNPTGTAERAVGRAYKEASDVDPSAVNRLAPSELQPGGPQAVMDTLGQPGRDLARSAANISGGAKDTLNQTLDPRFENQGARVGQWLKSKLNYGDAHSVQQAIDKVEKTVNSTNYGKAYAQGRVGIWDQDLAELSQAPVVKSATKDAIATALNKSASGTLGPSTQARWATQDGKPTLELWDLVKRQIDQDINVAKRAGKNEDVSTLTGVKNAILTKLDAAVPEYKAARQGAAGFFGAENALEAGQEFVTKNFAIPQTRDALARMSPAERQLFQDGFISRYMEILDKIPDRADVVRRIYNNPDAQKKFQLVLGPQRSAEMEAMLRIENIMQQGLRAVQGNSTTAAQLITAGAAGAGAGGYLGFDPTTSGVASALALAGKRGIDTRVALKVAEMLTSSDPAVLNRGLKMVAGNGRLMSAIRSADAASVRVGANEGSHAASSAFRVNPSAPAIGHAEDDQPKVPRPPGQ